MKLRLAALLTCALIAFGQRNRPDSPPAAAPHPWILDAVALDANGRPVADLTAADFELVQGGRARKIANFTWFDTRLHTSSTPGTLLPALDLLPDDVRRNLVVVVDDLGLSPAGFDAVCGTLKAFVADSMSPGDHMAILRASEGTGVLRQLTGDKRILLNAIDGIRYLGGGTSPAIAGSASWLTLVYALRGLRDFPGRKVVVLFTENPGAAAPPDRGVADAASAAHAAAAAVYALNPLPPAPGAATAATAAPGALESLARDTGGFLGGDFAQVLSNEQGYYAIGFQPEEDNFAGFSGSRPPATFAQLKVLRPGVVVRSRAGYISQPLQVDFPVPVERGVLLNTALRSPFAAPDIRVRLTALFWAYPKEGPSVDAVLLFDPHDISFIHDSEDMYRGAVHLGVAAYRDDGRSSALVEGDHQLNLRPAEYRYGLEHGLLFPFQMRLPGPGAWQIRTVVADNASDRIGSATRLVEVPNVPQGLLAISGVSLGGPAPLTDNAPSDPWANPAMRIFKPGHSCIYRYIVFNPLTGADKRSALEVQVRILAAGHVVVDGKPERVTFAESPDGLRRQITGPVKLDPLMAPGDYVLQVIVRDLLAPPGQPRTATQFTDFQVRQ
jgi:VWFA-related protein